MGDSATFPLIAWSIHVGSGGVGSRFVHPRGDRPGVIYLSLIGPSPIGLGIIHLPLIGPSRIGLGVVHLSGIGPGLVGRGHIGLGRIVIGRKGWRAEAQQRS